MTLHSASASGRGRFLQQKKSQPDDMCVRLGHRQGKHSDRVLRTKQGAVFGAALRFLQAPSAVRRKNRLSARGKHSDRVLRTKQGAVFGAALRFLQAPSAVRRKNRLSARGKHSDRVLRTKQGAVFGAALRFLQAPSAVRSKNRLSARGTQSAFFVFIYYKDCRQRASRVFPWSVWNTASISCRRAGSGGHS